MTKQRTRRTKLVCPGVARQHHLKVSGQRNALGSFLVRRRDAWFRNNSYGSLDVGVSQEPSPWFHQDEVSQWISDYISKQNKKIRGNFVDGGSSIFTKKDMGDMYFRFFGFKIDSKNLKQL